MRTVGVREYAGRSTIYISTITGGLECLIEKKQFIMGKTESLDHRRLMVRNIPKTKISLKILERHGKDALECTSDCLLKVKMSFRWSLMPMLMWMRCIGVFLDLPGAIRPSSRTRCLVISFGLILFFFHFYRNGYVFVVLAQHFTDLLSSSTSDKQQQPAVGAIWNGAISSLNQNMVTVFSQMFLMSAAALKWPRLAKVLCKMENSHFFDRRDYQRFRHIFTSGLAWLVTVGISCVVFK